MRKILIFMMIIMLCLSAASCGSKEGPAKEGPPEGTGESTDGGAPEASGEYIGDTGFLMPDSVCSVKSTSSEAMEHELYDEWYVIRYEDTGTCTDMYFEYEEYLNANFTSAGEQKYSDSDGNILLLAARMSDMEAYFGFGITRAK